jgi:uncharacterized radical SAM protein YgiQ
MFLPTTIEEIKKLGWSQLDVILVSGDTYIDSSYNGSAVIGKVLLKAGFKVGIIAQPNIEGSEDILRLGIPKLFWGVSAGCVDSMVANYTALKKRRKSDDFTPGGINNKRPDRACIAYTNLIKRYTKDNVKPIVLGGIEASLRRIVHYDYWSNKLRKSLLFDAKADILSYGMGEKSIVELAKNLSQGKGYEEIKGLCYISKEKVEGYLELPSFDQCVKDKKSFVDAFNIFYKNNDPATAKGLIQQMDNRFLVQNPPSDFLTQKEIDEVYDIEYERDVHPYYKKDGKVKAIDTIKDSITTHRGCYGECNFCAIAVHQGRRIIERSEESIIKEAEHISSRKGFKGYISDCGGPTANMYGIECSKKIKLGSCEDKRCLYPETCKALKPNHEKYTKLLKRIRRLPNVKKVFVASGIRYDMILDDKKNGNYFLEEIIEHHISGQMKIAPEHTEDKVLSFMGKQGKSKLVDFKNKFYEINKKHDKKQFLTYYLIAAHPGCDEKEMNKLKNFAREELRLNPEQVQIFTPTPSTYSTLMYYTEMNPFNGEKIFVEKDIAKKDKQKQIVIEKNNRMKTFKKKKK